MESLLARQLYCSKLAIFRYLIGLVEFLRSLRRTENMSLSLNSRKQLTLSTLLLERDTSIQSYLTLITGNLLFKLIQTKTLKDLKEQEVRKSQSQIMLMLRIEQRGDMLNQTQVDHMRIQKQEERPLFLITEKRSMKFHSKRTWAQKSKYKPFMIKEMECL